MHVGWNPKKPTELDGDDTTTLSYHPYILCLFAATYINMLCGFVSCVQRVVEGSVVGSAVVHVDVHEDWVMLWVAAMYNVLAILSMADTVCLACMQKLYMESMSSACWVCMVCMVYGLFKLCCEILLLLNIVDMDRWKTME